MKDDWDVLFRTAYGYIGEIKFLSNDEERDFKGPIFLKSNWAPSYFGTVTPALLQISAQLPFRYGKSRGETSDSWTRCRISAFISTDVFCPPIQMLRVGGPVTGFIEATNSKEHFGAQLTGRAKTIASEWNLLAVACFPEKIELNIDATSALPKLDRGNFPIDHAPNVTYGRFVK